MKFDYDYTALYSNDVRTQNSIIHVYECEATPFASFPLMQGRE